MPLCECAVIRIKTAGGLEADLVLKTVAAVGSQHGRTLFAYINSV